MYMNDIEIKSEDILNVDSLLSTLEELQSEDNSKVDSENDSNLDNNSSQNEQNNNEDQFADIEDIIKDIANIEDSPEETVYVKSIDDYDRSIYSDFQLKEIKAGLDHRLDVSIFDDVEMSARQMREIRYGLERNLDVTFYAKKYMRERQMIEIRRGLQDGLNVESYARLMLSPMDMHAKRKELFYEKYGENEFANLSYDYDDIDTGIHIYVDPGALEAGIVLKKPLDSKFTKFDLHNLMKHYDITDGFVDRELPQNLSNLPVGVKIVVMRGKAPIKGTDGEFIYTYPISEKNSPKINEDGTVDYYGSNNYVSIKEGDVLVKYKPATKGVNGRTVTGITILGTFGNELPPLTSDNLIYDEETSTYKAKRGGYLSLKDGDINIMDNLVFDNDVTGQNGPITFDGTVIINGSVRDNAQVFASGDIIVNGFVEVAKFNSGGDIIISGGANGDDRGSFIAKNNITVAFCENVFLDAGGNIEAGYLLNCNVNCGKTVRTKGKKSLICGGSVIASDGVEAGTIGTRTGARTYVEVGSSEEETERYMELDAEKKKIEASMAKIYEAIDQMIAKVGALVARKQPSYEKLQTVLSSYKDEEKEIEEKLEAIKQVIMEKNNCTINVTKEAYRNTILCINGNKLLLQEDLKASVFRTSGRTIVADK